MQVDGLHRLGLFGNVGYPLMYARSSAGVGADRYLRIIHFNVCPWSSLDSNDTYLIIYISLMICVSSAWNMALQWKDDSELMCQLFVLCNQVKFCILYILNSMYCVYASDTSPNRMM